MRVIFDDWHGGFIFSYCSLRLEMKLMKKAEDDRILN